MDNKTLSTPTNLQIIYEDNHLIAINKRPGDIVQGDKTGDAPLSEVVKEYIKTKYNKPGNVYLGVTHRLDRPTSGVLLFGLSKEIAQLMGEQFEQRLLQKTYWAIVRGYINNEGIIDHPIKPTADFKRDKERIAQKEAQEAITGYRRLGTLELPYLVDQFPTSRYSLVELSPQTGRKHQLRKHLKHLSHPTIGDPKYGKSKHNHFFKEHFNCHRLLLAATQLTFTHPITHAPLTISAPVEDVFSDISQLFTP